MRYIYIFTVSFLLLHDLPVYSYNFTQIRSVTIKSNGKVRNSVIKMKDIFHGITTDLADKVIAQSPTPGNEVSFDRDWLQQTAHYYSIELPQQLPQRIIVMREAYYVSQDHIADTILRHHQGDKMGENKNQNIISKVKFDNFQQMPIDIRHQQATPNVVTWQHTAGNRFNANIKIGERILPYSGQIVSYVKIPVIKRQITKDEVIKGNDIDYIQVPQNHVNGQIITNAKLLFNRSPKKMMLPAMTPIRASDLTFPTMVHKNQKITATITRPGIKASIKGIAKTTGKMGDVIEVLNPRSKTIISGVVDGYGSVKIN